MTAADVRERIITVGGVRTPLLEAGPAGADRAAVFVHGYPGSGRDWADLVPRAGLHTRALAWDAPGFGRADKPRGFPHTLAGHAEFIGRALDELGVHRVQLVMHDFGGPWALTWAARHIDRVASVVAIDTGAVLADRPHVLARTLRRRGVGEAVQVLTRPRVLSSTLKRSGLPAPYADRMAGDFDWGTKRAVLSLYRTLRPEQLRPAIIALRGADPPALIVWGARDPYLPVELAERQKEALPSAEVVVLPGSGHWPMGDDPERLAGLVVPFLAAHAAR
jgi:pimeloyl-ACP methyl ester carboxylesterase